MTCSPCGGGLKYWLNGRCYAGRSCGERYVGEWVSDGPDCCDPCNKCGNFVGPRCCGPGPRPLLFLWQSIVCGTPCNSCNSCGGAGCDSCGGGSSAYYGGEHGSLMHENWDHQPTPAVPGKNIHQAGQPTPAQIRTTQRPMPAGPMTQARAVSTSRAPASHYHR
ncbi:hypothetical protein [Anatilimnocola aggregata]|uniref:hypothetical protein n=1 Tax=Anatilimnocola aggregata TaxID=2528021 RepID=UPI00119DB195|nr:hypothetical protein [Anatilimnocola aggregata]